jgi:hypothetical protein
MCEKCGYFHLATAACMQDPQATQTDHTYRIGKCVTCGLAHLGPCVQAQQHSLSYTSNDKQITILLGNILEELKLIRSKL